MQPKKGSGDSSHLAPRFLQVYVNFFFWLQTMRHLRALTLLKILRSIWKSYSHAFKLGLEQTLQNASLAFLLLIISLLVYVLLWYFISNVNLDWEPQSMGTTKCRLIFQNE